VSAIGSISQTIRDISGIATTIAAAVEQQDSATRAAEPRRAARNRLQPQVTPFAVTLICIWRTSQLLISF
jgi:hypothetical protein